MMGSGTALIEACLMGIKSIGIDASPFCSFMAQAKLDGLTVPIEPLQEALANCPSIFDYFKRIAGEPRQGRMMQFKKEPSGKLWFSESEASYFLKANLEGLPAELQDKKIQRFLLLAYLDSAGYSERSDRKSPYVQFKAILERYLFVAEKIQTVLSGVESEMAESLPILGDARFLPLTDRCVDGIIFSPPYSFAIDYIENDSFHLKYLGADIADLRKRMVGLRGYALKEKYDLYLKDLERVLLECARVLRPGRFCTIIVGTNSSQLSKVFQIPENEVKGIDELIVELAGERGLSLVRKMDRQIVGMANTMRTEYILMFQRS